MEQIYSPGYSRIKINRKKLEHELGVKIFFQNECFYMDGDAISERKAALVIEALNLGFKLNEALLLKDDDYILEIINIKNLTRRRDLDRVRARIIGTKGKTKEVMQNLSDCIIAVKDSRVGIIGEAENAKDAVHAVTSVVQGSKQGNVYGFLEKERAKRKKELVEDLGLKYKPKK